LPHWDLFTIALVEFPDAPGERLMADVVDAALYELRVGLPVRLREEELGEVTLAALGESRNRQGLTGRGDIRETAARGQKPSAASRLLCSWEETACAFA
jgi:hypothetical protein